MSIKIKAVKNVDEYIVNAPEEVQGKLKEMRAAIKSVAPSAEEKISYVECRILAIKVA